MIVIGGGIIGLSCAWRLAQRGLPITLLDASATGSEASWAAAGMLAPGGEVHEDTPHARTALDSLALYPAFVAELTEASGLPIEFRPCGALELALTPDDAARLSARAALQSSLGIRSEPAPHPAALSARFYPDDAVVNPRDLTRALRAACLRLGVTIIEHEPVTAILDSGRSVRTARRTYSDDSTLLAAGAWSSPLWPGLPESTPIRGHLISYSLPPARLPHILRHNGTYLIQRASGLLIAGTTMENVGFDPTLDESLISDLRRRASTLLPDLAPLEPVERWIGFRPAIAGGTPLIARIEGTSLWTAYGHHRNGILLAPDTARRLTALVCL